MIDATLPPFVLTRNAALAATDRTTRKRFERGELVRLRAGVYLPASQWTSMDADARYRTRVWAASHKTQLGTQFSHDSAAAMLRLPSLGPWPAGIHLLVDRTTGGRVSSGLHRHGLGTDPHPLDISGMHVTPLARTAVDMACTAQFARAVVMVDDAMRTVATDEFRGVHGIVPISRDSLLEQLNCLEPYYGAARARKVILFSTGKSESPGESLSRVQFHAMGFAPPELQVPFFDEDGFIGRVDFYWPELDLIGEFDGMAKYRDPRFLNGRSPEEAVLDEKHREDRLRRVVRSFARWGWAEAADRARLSQRLAPHGLLRTR